MSSTPKTFRSQELFRAWLDAHHRTGQELILRCFKVAHSHRGVTYREALDEALCFGWIDGVRHAFDDVSFTVRFTPRKSRSVWSEVNIRRAQELQASGRLRPAGLEAFERRQTSSYSYEAAPEGLSRSMLTRFRAHKEAWRFFGQQPPWYQRVSAHWVMSGKRVDTRERRFALLIRSSEAGEPVPPLKRAAVDQSLGNGIAAVKR